MQEYSLTELETYKQIYPNAMLNLYGDVNQNINPNGLTEDDVQYIVNTGFIPFELKENYRNAEEITKYINKQFKTKMLAIGIPGTARSIEKKDFPDNIDFYGVSRFVVIVKDIENLDGLLDNYKGEINYVRDSSNSIYRNCLNVIPVWLVKGLEFEHVYAYVKGMSKNEKYVAFTRAFNDLTVIK